ncbi:hypothetical protein K3495_g3406 [Podosphaera aphanis]|nr:hypothetical protein K3495_g3406 [Podosphaera aphanis]
MSASQIPNLLTLRNDARSRGRARRSRTKDHLSTSQQNKDLDIQGTDTDAAVSRLSAVSSGYLSDSFASFFVQGQNSRRLPLINRGTYVRTTAIDLLINIFLAPDDLPQNTQRKQIISLGAGTDTRYFRLRQQNRHTNVIYHEFDFPSVSEAKMCTVMGNSSLSTCYNFEYPWPTLQSLEGHSEPKEWGFVRQEGNAQEIIYCFHPCDLRKIITSESVQSFTALRFDIPTLILSECCLCYMDVLESSQLIRWFTDKVKSTGIIMYEPIGTDDSFGKMMVTNLASRNIVMPSLNHYKSLNDQKLRLKELGFNDKYPKNGCEAETMEKIWDEWVPVGERERIDLLEGLDELEEWQMLARHYAIVWAWKSETDEWEVWQRLRDHIKSNSKEKKTL